MRVPEHKHRAQTSILSQRDNKRDSVHNRNTDESKVKDGCWNPCEVKTPEAKFRFQFLFKLFLFPHLKLLHFLLGGLVGNVDGVWGRDGLLGQSQPSIQVVVLLHKLVPEQPSPLQPGRNMHKVRSFQAEQETWEKCNCAVISLQCKFIVQNWPQLKKCCRVAAQQLLKIHHLFYWLLRSDYQLKDTHCPQSCRSPSWLQLLSTRCISSFSSTGDDWTGSRHWYRSRRCSVSLTSSPGTTSLPAGFGVMLLWRSEVGRSMPGISTSCDLYLMEKTPLIRIHINSETYA